MTTEDLLGLLAGTAPTQDNLTPGFSPILRRRGVVALGAFTPCTAREDQLIERACLLLGEFTAEQHSAFRLSLLMVYRELGYTAEELRPSFPEYALTGPEWDDL